MFKIVLIISLAAFVGGCGGGNVTPNLHNKEEAMALLNSGQAKSIGVGHSGWLEIEMLDGTDFIGRDSVVGYPAQLLHECSKCEDVSTWLE